MDRKTHCIWHSKNGARAMLSLLCVTKYSEIHHPKIGYASCISRSLVLQVQIHRKCYSYSGFGVTDAMWTSVVLLSFLCITEIFVDVHITMINRYLCSILKAVSRQLLRLQYLLCTALRCPHHPSERFHGSK